MILLSILYLAAIHFGLHPAQTIQSNTPRPATTQSQPPAAQKNDSSTSSTKAQPKQSPTSQPKHPAWQVAVITAPFTAITVHAKKAPVADVAAELSRKLKIPVVLAPKIKQETLTTEFDNFPLETALRLMAPKVIIDYVLTGGEGPVPTKKEAVAVYLMALGESPSREGPYVINKAGAQLVVGTVYASEEEEKAAKELKKTALQVTEENGVFNIRADKQYLTDVLQEIADKARIPFDLVTTNGNQPEIDQIVTWDIKAVTLEQLTRGWLPNGIRLYSRTDLQSYVDKPLRLTIEPLDATQVERIVTP